MEGLLSTGSTPSSFSQKDPILKAFSVPKLIISMRFNYFCTKLGPKGTFRQICCIQINIYPQNSFDTKCGVFYLKHKDRVCNLLLFN